MSIKIKKEYPLQYHVVCELCGKDGFVNKLYFKKNGWNVHKCQVVSNPAYNPIPSEPTEMLMEIWENGYKRTEKVINNHLVEVYEPIPEPKKRGRKKSDQQSINNTDVLAADKD